MRKARNSGEFANVKQAATPASLPHPNYEVGRVRLSKVSPKRVPPHPSMRRGVGMMRSLSKTPRLSLFT